MHLDKPFVKSARKKRPHREIFGAFSRRYSYNYILNGRFNPWMDTIWVFFQNQETFSYFQQRAGETPHLPPSCESVSLLLILYLQFLQEIYMIPKIVQVDRASNTDCYGIFLLLLWFCVNQTKSKILGKTENTKKIFVCLHYKYI